MQIIISPAKSLDYETPLDYSKSSTPRLLKESQEIVNKINTLSINELADLMKISDKLAELNFSRFKHWKYPYDKNMIRQSLFAFKGDVYTGLDAYSLTPEDIEYTNNHLRILSGLYGLLRPLDMIMPYRLEMGTKLEVGEAKNLYKYWGDKITNLLNKDIEENNDNTLINLASNEYFKSLNTKIINAKIITPEFKDNKNGNYKIISFYAKKARGLMTRFIVKNKITNAEDLQAFDYNGYAFNPRMSTEDKPVFTRG